MINQTIVLSRPFFDQAEVNAVKKVLKSGWVAGQGPMNIQLAEYVKKMIGVKYAIPVNNCTAGLHLALLALRIKPGDEIIVSDFTFPASGHAVMYCGAKPRFVDININTYNIDVNQIEKKINIHTKAIVVVHAFGLMAQMDKIVNIANKYKLKIVEDAACALGASYNGKPAGSYGDIAAFSFHARKNVTSGEGGFVVTNNKNYAELITSLSCFGMLSKKNKANNREAYSFMHLGYNYKLSDINASIALEQLKKFDSILNKKRQLATLYTQLLSNNKYIIPPKEIEGNFHVYQSYVILLHKIIKRDKLIKALHVDGIQTQFGTYASHIQPVYYSKDKCPNSLFLYKHTLSLPIYYKLNNRDVVYIVKKLISRINSQI